MKPAFEIPLREMLDGLSMNSRDAVDRLLDAVEVDYLVAFESPDGSNRRLVAVGPDLDYTDFDAVCGMQIDDMYAAFYANASLANSARRLSDPEIDQKEAGVLSQRLAEVEGEKEELARRCEALEQSKEKLKEEVATLRASLEDAPSLDRKMAAIEERSKTLKHFEQELNKMEEEMVTRMNEYMEKMAHLEQWEEDLFHREASLNEKTENSA